MKDLRDPSELGTTLLESARAARGTWGAIPLSEIWDVHVQRLAHPDYRDPANALERYGDPVKKHQARIVLGLEKELP